MARYKVAQKGFTSNHLLNINAVLETVDKYPHIFNDVIHMEFAEGIKKNNVYSGYDTNNKIDVTFSAYELRVFIYALRNFVTNKKSDYKKYNNPALAKSTDNVKEITFGYSNEKFYINVEEMNKKKFGIPFDAFEIRAFLDSLEIIVKECDEILYKFQRAMDKKINSDKN